MWGLDKQNKSLPDGNNLLDQNARLRSHHLKAFLSRDEILKANKDQVAYNMSVFDKQHNAKYNRDECAVRIIPVLFNKRNKGKQVHKYATEQAD